MAGVFSQKSIVAFAIVLGSICLSNAAGAASRVAPYDLGYAYQASQNCPGFKLTVPVPDDVKTNPRFLDGVAMVDGMLKKLPKERACAFARRLYSTKEGSAAKIIETEQASSLIQPHDDDFGTKSSAARKPVKSSVM